MDGSEAIVLLASLAFTVFAGVRWYSTLVSVWPGERNLRERVILGVLPGAAFFIILFTLRTLASYDVVDSPPYIALYLALGFAWLALGVLLMTSLFDLSWSHDIVMLGNRAALWAFIGGFLGLTIMYAASNIGDGPGWWCVVFTGALGLAAFVVLGWCVHGTTGAFERVTVERDATCGLRLGCYLLAIGIVLGRAAAGDWISFSATLEDFFASGWPALPLTLFMILAERLLTARSREGESEDVRILSSAFLGILFIALAIAGVLLLPSPAGNPIYGRAVAP